MAMGWQPHSREEQIQFFVATSQWKRAGLFGAAAVQSLAAVLADGSYERRVAAANVLGEIGDASALKPLLGALKDSDAPVRSAAANALGRFAGVQVVPQLIAVLADPDRNVRAAVAGALGELGDAVAVEPLMQFLEDADWEVRTAALGALGRLGDRRAVEPAAACLEDKEEEVRQQAAETLGRLGDASVLEPLVLALVDEQSSVRQAAARSLSILDSYWERSVAAHTLIPRIEVALQHNNASVQYAAAGLLRRLTGRLPTAAAHTDSERKTRVLVRILQDLLLDADAEVRLAAAESMGRLRWSAYAGALKTALDDSSDWVKRAAREALEEIARAQASAPGR
jgi:HEAT repeat protein